ncbi:MAG: hypothetical protein GY826_32930 [Fuerstiella sp.]|nr:hypothetical protein [Fuerstiella sp.]
MEIADYSDHRRRRILPQLQRAQRVKRLPQHDLRGLGYLAATIKSDEISLFTVNLNNAVVSTKVKKPSI